MFANSVRRKPTAPSGSPTGGGPCGDPGVGTACGAPGRAWPRWVSLSSPGVICGEVGSLAMINCPFTLQCWCWRSAQGVPTRVLESRGGAGPRCIRRGPDCAVSPGLTGGCGSQEVADGGAVVIPQVWQMGTGSGLAAVRVDVRPDTDSRRA